MKIKDILAKLAKGEKPSDDEMKALSEYDPQKEVDTAAAAARRKAEQDKADSDKAVGDLKTQLADLQKQLADADKGKMTETEKAAKVISDLQQQIAGLQKAFGDKEAEAKKLARQTKVDEVIRASGIQFRDGIDKKILTSALAASFAGVKDEDLDSVDATKPILEGFRSANKAVILDASGHGSGAVPGQKVEVGVVTGKPIDQMTPAERQSDLKKRGII